MTQSFTRLAIFLSKMNPLLQEILSLRSEIEREDRTNAVFLADLESKDKV